EVATTAPGVRPQEFTPVGIGVVPSGQHEFDRAVGSHHRHLHRVQVVHGEPLLAGEQTVAASGDVSTHTHRVTGAARQGPSTERVQVAVDMPVGGARLHAVRLQRGIVGDSAHRADVQDHADVFATDAVFVAAAGR